MPDILGEIVLDVGSKVQKQWVLWLKRWSLSVRVSDEERRERERLSRCSSSER